MPYLSPPTKHYKEMKKTRFVLLLIISVLLTGCAGELTDTRPRIAVSIEPLRYFTEQIAGDRYKITTLMPTGGSPETYEPTPHQMVELSQSQLFFAVGTLGFEQTQLGKMAETAPELKIVPLMKGVNLLAAHHGGNTSNSADPHVWMSTNNARILASNICDALCEADSANAKTYTDNLKRFDASVDSIDAVIRAELKDVSHRTFLIYHPALGYFARDYGLRQLAVEQDGKESSAARMQQLITTCKAENVRVVFIEKEYSGKSARRIAEQLGAKVSIINPLGYDWPAELSTISKALKNEGTTQVR